MGRLSVLSIKQQMDAKGEYFDLMLNMDGQLTRCFIRSQLGRNELLKKLYFASTLDDLYSIDDKAIMYIA